MKNLITIFIISTIACISIEGNKINAPKTKAQLGRKLFFDPILSSTKKISCASCHLEKFAFSDTISFSKGVYGRMGTRNTPSVMNTALQATFFWDGRAATLEEQVLVPIQNPVEMNMPIDSAVSRINNNKNYVQYFQNIYHQSPTKDNLANAIAEFERTLETADTPFDNWIETNNPKLISASAKRGNKLFNEKGKCIKCHFGPDFNNVEFKNIGMFDGKKFNDSGRAAITHNSTDLGKFKIASLRNISITSPYMHNGMFKTLDEVINFYNDPEKIVPNSQNRDSLLLKPLGLNTNEKKDLKSFLLTLTDKRFLKKK